MFQQKSEVTKPIQCLYIKLATRKSQEGHGAYSRGSDSRKVKARQIPGGAKGYELWSNLRKEYCKQRSSKCSALVWAVCLMCLCSKQMVGSPGLGRGQ